MLDLCKLQVGFQIISKTLEIDKEFVTNAQPATAVILTVRETYSFHFIYICILKSLNEIMHVKNLSKKRISVNSLSEITGEQ